MVERSTQAIRRGPMPALAAVSLAPPAVRFSFRGSAEAARKAGPAFGCDLPTEACRAAVADDRAALWLGSDEWLLLAFDDPAVQELAQTIETALGDVPHALVDISHRQVGIEVFGPAAPQVLNVGCPLDLALEAFPVGMSTRTVLAKADITLWRQAEDRFRLETGRSFSPYVVALLAQAQANLD